MLGDNRALMGRYDVDASVLMFTMPGETLFGERNGLREK